MEYSLLSSSVEIKTIEESATAGIFEVGGLFAGYGLTVGNAIRRTLLSSLPGAAVTQIKINGIAHEFSTLPGVKEDMVEFSLNFKKLRFRLHDYEIPFTFPLHVKGEKEVTGADIKLTSEAELMNPGEVLGHLTSKSAEIDMEVKVERGLGYWPVEARKSTEKLPIGAIAIDAIFSPVRKVNYTIENMRVGDRTDYNRLKIEIETDGTISPSSALHKSASILKDHFDKIMGLDVRQDPQVAMRKAAKKKKEKETVEAKEE